MAIRPRQKMMVQNTKQSGIEVGDEVMTTSGLIGIVDQVNNDRVWLEVSPGVIVEFVASAIREKVQPSALYPTDSDTDQDDVLNAENSTLASEEKSDGETEPESNEDKAS